MSTKNVVHNPAIYFPPEETNSLTNIFWDMKENPFAYLVIVTVGVFVVWLAFALIRSTRNLRRRYRELLASGFNPHYVMDGATVFAIDKDRRELAVIYSDATFRYRFDQIQEWRYEWDTRNGVRINNRVIINVLDPDHPRHVAKNASTRACEQWQARMSALLNMAVA
jgi:hypothetical protein